MGRKSKKIQCSKCPESNFVQKAGLPTHCNRFNKSIEFKDGEWFVWNNNQLVRINCNKIKKVETHGSSQCDAKSLV